MFASLFQHRDDFRRRDTPAKANETKIPFIIEGKKVVLVDDVVYTGRSVRAALDAMIAARDSYSLNADSFLGMMKDAGVKPDKVLQGKVAKALEEQGK